MVPGYDRVAEVSRDPLKDQAGPGGIRQDPSVEAAQEIGQALQALQVARRSGDSLGRLVTQPLGRHLAGRIRAGIFRLEYQVHLPGYAHLLPDGLGCQQRRVRSRHQLGRVGFNLQCGQPRPAGQSDRRQEQDGCHREHCRASQPPSGRSVQPATDQGTRAHTPEQQEPGETDQQVCQIGHRHAQGHERGELANQWDRRRQEGRDLLHHRGGRNREGQHPGRSGQGCQPGRRQYPSRGSPDPMTDVARFLRDAVHRLDEVVGGEPDDDRQDRQGGRCHG